MVGGNALADLGKVGILDLEGKRAALEAGVGKAGYKLDDKVVELDDDYRALADVAQIGLLAANRLAYIVGHNRAEVDATGKVVITLPILPKTSQR